VVSIFKIKTLIGKIMDVFSNAVLEKVLESRSNYFIDNFDPMMQYDARYKAPKEKSSLAEKILDLRIPLGTEIEAKRRLFDGLSPHKFYKKIIKPFGEISFLYDLLADEFSKSLLVQLVAYKILGYKHIKLPRNNPKYWHDIKNMEKLAVGHGDFKINFVNLNLILMDLNPLGYDVLANITPAGAAAIFAQKQYEYTQGDVCVKVHDGDVVLDCGACWGETSLYFAHEVGATGKVYSFEFIPENMNIFERNVNQNIRLKDRIQLIPHPVWDKSDEVLKYLDHGPGSSVHKSDAATTGTEQICHTLSIDDLVDRHQLSRIDFIKMDIEGAELNALHGAEKSLRKYKPKLAISLYHKPDDFVTIPNYLNNLKLGYKFYLDHHTIHFWETVLYCVPA